MPPEIYRMSAQVARIEEKKHTVSVVPIKQDDGSKISHTETESDGWFITLSGLNVSIGVGPDKPALKVGDPLRITIEVDHG